MSWLLLLLPLLFCFLFCFVFFSFSSVRFSHAPPLAAGQRFKKNFFLLDCPVGRLGNAVFLEFRPLGVFFWGFCFSIDFPSIAFRSVFFSFVFFPSPYWLAARSRCAKAWPTWNATTTSTAIWPRATASSERRTRSRWPTLAWPGNPTLAHFHSQSTIKESHPKNEGSVLLLLLLLLLFLVSHQ